jgi:hypothetical protein
MCGCDECSEASLSALSFDPAVMEAEAREVSRVVATRDPWLERRGLHFGASEIAALMIALGLRSPIGVPKYMAENAKKLLHVKAGLRRPGKVGRAAAEGTRSERALVAAFSADTACPVRDLLTSITHSDAAPRSFWPLVDRYCPRLSCTPDAWGRDITGADVLIEAKCTTEPLPSPHWYWTIQVQAQLAVTACEWGAVVIGDGWAAHWKQPGDVHAHVVERDEVVIAEIRSAVTDGWQRVEALRAASAAGGA